MTNPRSRLRQPRSVDLALSLLEQLPRTRSVGPGATVRRRHTLHHHAIYTKTRGTKDFSPQNGCPCCSLAIERGRCDEIDRFFRTLDLSGETISEVYRASIRWGNNALPGAIYSLIETAKHNGLEPHAYLQYVLEELPYGDTELEELLPYNMSADMFEK